MRRYISCLFLAIAVAFAMYAKDGNNVLMRAITGIVVDEEGTPLAGALIESPDKDFSTTTAADGTFSLEVSSQTKSLKATYPGLPPKSEKLKNRKESTEHVTFTLDKAKSGTIAASSTAATWAMQKSEENKRNKEMREGGNAATTRTIMGIVVDKAESPLEGATVEATGGAETVTTDADGSFTMEIPFWLKSITVSYPGMKAKKFELDYKKQNENVLIIKMGKKKK